MQLGLDKDQVEFIKTWIKDPTVVGFLWWIIRRSIAKSRELIHTIITDNANRIRDEITAEIQASLTKRFEEHEQNAFARLEQIAAKVTKENK